MQAFLRHICYLAAMGEFEIMAKHIQGISNFVSDLLSRMHLDDKYSKEFTEIFVGTEVFVSNEYFSGFRYRPRVNGTAEGVREF